MEQPTKAFRSDCFAFGATNGGHCRALIVDNCIDCKFYKTKEEIKYQEYVCQIRLNELKLKGGEKREI